MKEGVLWRVGNGDSINIWDAPWVADDEGRFITSHVRDDVQKVSQLIDPNCMAWKMELIDEIFNERDKRCILAIPLNLPATNDDLIWAFSKIGHYSVNTSYMLGKGCNLDLFHNAWVEIWSLNVSPKVRQFCGVYALTRCRFTLCCSSAISLMRLPVHGVMVNWKRLLMRYFNVHALMFCGWTMAVQ